MEGKLDNKIVNEYSDVLNHEFEMPECEFCATCGSCRYYEMYGFGKAYCNYHKRDTSSSNSACGAYE